MLTSTQPITQLGSIKYGKAKRFTIPVRNEGPRSIQIDKLVVGCGSCTKATLLKNTIDTEEEVLMNVVFTPGTTGQQTKTITIRYDNDQVLELQFTAEVYA